MKAVYKADPTILERIGDGVKAAHAADPELGKRHGIAIKAAHAADPTLRIRTGKAIKDSFNADPTILERIGNGTRGGQWINNGIKRQRLKPGEPIPEGWSLGRGPLGSRWITCT